MIKLGKSDIGGEVISILTRGMYSDPRDSLREYVQNGIDAGAKNIDIKIRQEIVVVVDDGKGMNHTTMRKAISIGISDKNPKENVGFMGIGIYSSFHLCDKLVIFSKEKNKNPNKLVFNFKRMRDILEYQKEGRFSSKIDDSQLIALQTLLEKHTELYEIDKEEFPKVGTRVEMEGINPIFFKSLHKFKEVTNYLEQVIPLPFNPKFKWGKLIQNKIDEICKKYGRVFKLINVNLQINEKTAKLFRPYLDDKFDPKPLDPTFHELKKDKNFFGVAWGCLNSSNNAIKDKKLRGFLIKKQGFSIGTRNDLAKYFGRRTLFNRYIGEIIVVHPRLLPNAPRTDFEISSLRTTFNSLLQTMASVYSKEASRHQELRKSAEELNGAIAYVKETKANLKFYVDNDEKLLDIIVKLVGLRDSLKKRKQRGFIPEERLKDEEKIKKSIINLIKEIKQILFLKSKKRKREKLKTTKQLASDLTKMPKEIKLDSKEPEFENLIEVTKYLEIELNDDLKKIFRIIDEEFIQTSSDTTEEYKMKLKKLKQDIEEAIAED